MIYQSDALDFTCSACGARPGERCINLTASPLPLLRLALSAEERCSIELKAPHAARMLEARKEYRGL